MADQLWLMTRIREEEEEDLRQLRLIRRLLTIDTAHALVRALIHSRLDYCNGVFAGLPAGLFNCLQSVLRAAARLVLGLPGGAPVMSAIRDTLHWLSYPQRVTFKLCLTTYKCLHLQTILENSSFQQQF